MFIRANTQPLVRTVELGSKPEAECVDMRIKGIVNIEWNALSNKLGARCNVTAHGDLQHSKSLVSIRRCNVTDHDASRPRLGKSSQSSINRFGDSESFR
jgi:hypothetical protein